MDDGDSSVNNDASVLTCGLSKNEVIKLLFNQHRDIALVTPEKFKSLIWERFRLVYFKGVKLNYVQCIGCSLVLVYKSRTGTASLLRHRCARFPISVYDLKLENHKALLAVAEQHHIFSEMASSSNNGIVELKQEMLSDDDSMEQEDHQYSNDQTDEGLLQTFSLLEKSFMGSDEVLLTREEIENAHRSQDPDLFFERPRNHRHSNTWDRFEIVYYRDTRQNFAKCLSCSSIVSYKKTTGTASLIRHKCKPAKNHQNQPTNSTSIKAESLINLLTTQQKTPAPTPVAQLSSSSSAVSSTITTTVVKPAPSVKASRSENVSMMDLAGKNVALSQIHLLSQVMLETSILCDPTYLNFLQSLVNFGADFGKQSVTNFINQQTIRQELIPKRCDDVRNELVKLMHGSEFSISHHKWTNINNEKYVTVVGYFFTPNFEYWHKTLGTASCSDATEMDVIRDITDGYKTSKSITIKCVGDKSIDGFETFPCIVAQISKVIKTAMNSSDESVAYFKNLLQVISETLEIPLKNCDDDDKKLKMLYKFHLHLKSIDDYDDEVLMEKFNQLLGMLFSAITSLTKMSEDGVERCVTANEIYLWCKKFLKFYSTFQSDDKVIDGIRISILHSIKVNLTNKIQELYKVSVFLDPNFKNLKFLDSSERAGLLDIVKKNLQNIINYDEGSEPISKKQKVIPNQSKSHLSDTFLEFMDITMESVDDQVNSEIQCYMGFKLENPVDVVEFWRMNDCFPYLKQLARNLLNLPSCTFHSDCCFLSVGHEFYQKCRNLPAEDVETLTFLHQN